MPLAPLFGNVSVGIMPKEYNDLTKDVERCTKIPIFFKYYICKGLFALCRLNAYQKKHDIAARCDGNDFLLFPLTVTHGVLQRPWFSYRNFRTN